MAKEITITEALALPGAKFIDVRSESEFSEAAVPDAVNIPLLTDEERVRVGTAYKQHGVDEARSLGLEFVSPRLSAMVDDYRRMSVEGPLVVYCWRGGMRSKSVCSLLESLGIPVYRLVGGYKAYRRYVNEYLDRPLPHKVAVIHGLTGVGKTELLEELARLGSPSVDLEGLANNRGSVFGQIGMQPQPSQKMFDGLLVRELAFWEPLGHIIVECESRRIGRIILPASLVQAMKSGIRILAFCPIGERIRRIKRIYAGDDGDNKEELKKAIMSLGQRVGRKRAEEFSRQVDEGRLDEIVEYLLVHYYDPLYRYPDTADPSYDLSVDTSDIKAAAERIHSFLQNRYKHAVSAY